MLKNTLKIAGAAFLVLMFFGCDLLDEAATYSITERIEAFEDTLNDGDYSNLKTHFHPAMESYDTYLKEEVFSSGPLSSGNAPFNFELLATTDGSGDDKTASGTLTHLNLDDGLFTATMREDGDDNWKIYDMTITVDDYPYLIKGLSE
ncbi:hypothetical protein EXM22_04370 [Oceanispirochaeta crateris]|uniref:DUF4878 domain-containing protein n=1 Tax=Oceanispirochaeta crateris TaxID=2518645 RepID=A0A5C1QIG5_9SPIO|nr:hypothetical protein [Oceanispirochaeta crateris]QEN07257.1 hypothetical protein EXM22_04370 [Oceanispirochaeta crateris]